MDILAKFRNDDRLKLGCRGLGPEDPYPAEFQRVQFLTSRSIESRKRGASSRRGGFGRDRNNDRIAWERLGADCRCVPLSRNSLLWSYLAAQKAHRRWRLRNCYNIPSSMFVCVRTCVCIYIYFFFYYIYIDIGYFCSREHDPLTRIVLPEEKRRIESRKWGFLLEIRGRNASLFLSVMGKLICITKFPSFKIFIIILTGLSLSS